MSLADIADGLKVTTEQSDRGVATVDRTAVSLSAALAPHESELPCSAETAATVVEAYATGTSIADSARVADVPPMLAAKTLHRLGETMAPLDPEARRLVRDWINGERSRSEALELTHASDAEFVLTAYIETHEPCAAARAAVEGVLGARRRSASPRAALEGTITEK